MWIKERGGGQTFSTSFWMRFSHAPLRGYRFKVIFDDIIVLLSGNIIEYICFWRFNSIIMTWNKLLVFTKSVIMGLNNISPWPCPLGVVCLPCVITWLYSTPLLSMQAVGVVVCLSLRMANFSGSRRTHFSVVSVIFYCWHCFVLFYLVFTQGLIFPFFFSHLHCHINFYFPFSQFMCRCKDWNTYKNWWYFCTVLLREITQNKTDMNIANVSILLPFLEKVPWKGAFFFSSIWQLYIRDIIFEI